MELQEYKDLIPNSKLTPQSINDIYFSLTTVRQDVTKFRLVSFGSARLLGSTLSAGTNEVIVVLNAVGNGQLIFESASSLDSPKADLNEIVSVEITETTGTASVIVQYALFSWN